MAGYPKVKGYLVEKGIKQKEVAAVLKMTTSTFNNKLNGFSDFTISDVKKMCYEFGMNAEIFFDDFVPNKQRKLN